MRTLTPDEVQKLALTPREKYALVNKNTGKLFLGSDASESCDEVLQKMKDNKHPEADNLELVQQP